MNGSSGFARHAKTRLFLRLDFFLSRNQQRKNKTPALAVA